MQRYSCYHGEERKEDQAVELLRRDWERDGHSLFGHTCCLRDSSGYAAGRRIKRVLVSWM